MFIMLIVASSEVDLITDSMENDAWGRNLDPNSLTFVRSSGKA